MRSNPYAHPCKPVRLESPVEATLEVGIALVLGPVWGLFPSVDGRIHPLHRQIRALDQSDLDLPSLLTMTSLCPLGEALQGTKGIREIGLEDDAGRDRGKLVLLEDPHKGLECQIEILVFLHVEVDELGCGAVRGHPVQPAEPVFDQFGCVVEGPQVQGGDDRGDLHRDVVDVVAL